MSTLKVNEIQDTSGGSSNLTIPGAAKAWVNYNQVSPAIRDSFNVSSVTDHSTGLLTLNFTNALANANYAFAGTAGHVSPSGSTTAIFTVELPDAANISSVMTTSSLQVEVNYVTASDNRSITDREFVSVIVFGD